MMVLNLMKHPKRGDLTSSHRHAPEIHHVRYSHNTEGETATGDISTVPMYGIAWILASTHSAMKTVEPIRPLVVVVRCRGSMIFKTPVNIECK